MFLICQYLSIHPCVVLILQLIGQTLVVHVGRFDEAGAFLVLIAFLPVILHQRNDNEMNGVARRKQFKLRPWQSTASPLRQDCW
ncbi:unnamed protein product [Caenorhabditis bovis]|uniref:Uncharacterized protein n=1 Tax=Caenorhabditis bovis TaxID=2654633 RepID=A0A8S1FFK0_9PELO|nr:unnamed protein product [Caenorhabditis bovis]